MPKPLLIIPVPPDAALGNALQLQERNVVMELDLARAAMETVVRQLAAVTKTNQVSSLCLLQQAVSGGLAAQRAALGQDRPRHACMHAVVL